MRDSQRITGADILDVFDRLEDSSESLATSEIADVLDCAHRTAYSKLDALVDEGYLNTKNVGAQVRIWWRPRDIDTHPPPSETTGDFLSDEVLELELRSEQIARPLYEAAESDFQVSNDGIIPLDDGTHLQYYTARGISGKAYVETTEQYPAVHNVRLIRNIDDTTKIEVRSDPNSFTTIFSNYSGRFKSADITGGTAILIGDVPRTVDVDALLADLKELYPDIELASQNPAHTPHLFYSVVKDSLTDRQWTALQMAHFAGYFEWPRLSTGEELAERLGITKQTYHYHLRHAEQVVFQRLFMGYNNSEALATDHSDGSNWSD